MPRQVTITLDQVAVQTLKMGLAALRLQADATDVLFSARVQAAIDAESAKTAGPAGDPIDPAHLNGHARDPAVEASVDL